MQGGREDREEGNHAGGMPPRLADDKGDDKADDKGEREKES